MEWVLIIKLDFRRLNRCVQKYVIAITVLKIRHVRLAFIKIRLYLKKKLTAKKTEYRVVGIR